MLILQYTQTQDVVFSYKLKHYMQCLKIIFHSGATTTIKNSTFYYLMLSLNLRVTIV